MKKRIEERLRENLKPKFLEVKNNSHLHSGHLGDDGSGQTHFAIIVESDELENITKVQAHRKVNGLLKDEFLNGMHALEIEVRSKK